MGERQGAAVLQVRPDFGPVYVGLFFIGDEDHGHIGFPDGFGDGPDRQARLAGRFGGPAALIQADHHVDAAFLQVQRMGVALAAVADDGDRLALHDIPVDILIVKYFCHNQNLSLSCFFPGGVGYVVPASAVSGA